MRDGRTDRQSDLWSRVYETNNETWRDTDPTFSHTADQSHLGEVGLNRSFGSASVTNSFGYFGKSSVSAEASVVVQNIYKIGLVLIGSVTIGHFWMSSVSADLKIAASVKPYLFVSTKFHFDETISLAGLVS